MTLSFDHQLGILSSCLPRPIYFLSSHVHLFDWNRFIHFGSLSIIREIIPWRHPFPVGSPLFSQCTRAWSISNCMFIYIYTHMYRFHILYIYYLFISFLLLLYQHHENIFRFSIYFHGTSLTSFSQAAVSTTNSSTPIVTNLRALGCIAGRGTSTQEYPTTTAVP